MSLYTPSTFKGFTLVELIITITIIAILGTIGFFSLQSYALESRNATRISNLRNIEGALNTILAKDAILPLPDDKVDITASGSNIVGYQGKFGEKSSTVIQYGNHTRDVITNDYPIYGINARGKLYHLAIPLETLESSITQTAYAASPMITKYAEAGNGGIILLDSTRKSITEPIDLALITNTHTVLSSMGELSGTGADLIKVTALISPENSFAKSCKEILGTGLSRGDGEYSINPTGTLRFQTYCDMTTDGGGWTLIMNAAGTSNLEKSMTGVVTGNLLNTIGVSAAYSTLPLGNDLIIESKIGILDGKINTPDTRRVDLFKGIATSGFTIKTLANGIANNRILNSQSTTIILQGSELFGGDLRQSIESKILCWNDTEGIYPGFIFGMYGHGNAAGWPDYSNYDTVGGSYTYHWPRNMRIWTR